MRRLLVTLAVAMLLGCGETPDSPEAAIRAALDAAVAGAEARDIDPFKGLLAEDFNAGRRDRGEALNLIRLYMLRNQQIHVLTRYRRIELRGDTSAEVVLVAATAGRPLPEDEQSLAGFRADFHRLHLFLERSKDGEWRVYRAEWERAGPGDFIKL